MRAFIRHTVRIAALLLLVPCLLASCAQSTVSLTYRDGAYRSKNEKAAFLEAPPTYYALSALNDKAVAVIKRSGMRDIPLYAIENCDSATYLADENLMLYYAEGTTLPTLAELNATKLALYQYSETRVTRQIVATLEEHDKVTDLVRRATTDAKIPAEQITQELYHRMELLFLSETYAGFGLMLEYRKFSTDVELYAPLNTDGTAPDLYPGLTPDIRTVAGEQTAVWNFGTNFIYDRTEKTYTPVWDVLEAYFIGDETDTQS